MLKNYYQLFTKPILFLLLVLLVAGAYSYTQMHTALFPELTFPKIQLVAENGQQPVDRQMITVTRPLEIAVKRVKGMSTVRSTTARGSTTLDLYFTWNTDIYQAKLQLESRIAEIQTQLPQGLSIRMEAMNQSIYPVMGYTLESRRGTTADPIALRDKANLLVRPLLAQVPGIANVAIKGGKAKTYVVIPDAYKMSALGITTSVLINALTGTNFVLSNGNLAGYSRLYLTLTDTRLDSPDALRKVVVKNDAGRLVHLSDIALIDVEQQQEFIIVNANGHDAVLVDVVKQQGENLMSFAEAVRAKVKEIQPLLPQNMVLRPYYDQSVFVQGSVDSVVRSIYEGLALAILVVILFLRSARASLTLVLTIPVTIAFTILVLYVAGIGIDIMSLGAIAASIGLIIDDAIVIIEQIYRVHEEHPDRDNVSVVQKAIHDLFPAMVGSSLTTIVIHFPFALMTGVAGGFFRELSTTMQITMVCSFLVTWLGTPVIHLLLGYSGAGHKAKPSDHNPKSLRWLTWTFDKPLFAIFFVLLLAGGAYFSVTQLETGFLPDLDEGTVVLDYFSLPGTSLEQTDYSLRQIEKIILAHPDVATYSRRTGFDMQYAPLPQNWGDMLIQLKTDRKEKTEEVINDLRVQIQATQPTLNVQFGQRIADLLGDLISTASPIEVKIFGDDQAKLEALSRRAQALLQKIPGLADVENGIIVAGPNLFFVPDAEKLALYKVPLMDYQLQLQAYTGGVVCGEMQDGEQMRELTLRYTHFRANDLNRILSQQIFLPDGSVKPLSFFTKVHVVPGETELRRENLKSEVVLTGRLDRRDLGSVIKDIQHTLRMQLPLPPGYTIGYGGAFAEQQASFSELLLILVLASILVFGVLIFLFRAWLISLTILLISLLGIGGCLLALYITGIPLNVGSYTGIIMIVGIVAENAIFTAQQFFNNLKETNDVDGSIKFAIALRIRPKLMTATGAILALMPLALGIGLGAQMQQPLAVAVIGGFVAGLPLLLFVFPSLIRLIYHRATKTSQT